MAMKSRAVRILSRPWGMQLLSVYCPGSLLYSFAFQSSLEMNSWAESGLLSLVYAL